jgi:hypothetical protein
MDFRESVNMWTRRKLIETAAAGTAGLVLAGGRACAQVSSGSDHDHHDAMWKACAEACSDCAKACNESFHHCVTQAVAGKAEHARMAQIAADCAAFCALSAQMLERSSTLAMLSCNACAEACKLCAKECDSFDSGAEMMACSRECRRCEASCRKMIQGGTGAQNAAPAERNVRRPAGN